MPLVATITIEDVKPFDGEYTIDFDDSFNGYELNLIKKVSGCRLGEIGDGLAAADYDLFVAFGAICLWRAEKVEKQTVMQAVDKLMSADAGKLKVKLPDEKVEDDARPPESEPGSTGREADSSPPSSPISNGTGDDHPETTLTSIGEPTWGPSAT
jgi:hypothetical protein